jgi:hypothetical protein
MKHAFCALPQNRKPPRRPTSWFCLWFWRNRYNAVAMFLARAFRTGIHPPEITQNGGCSGAWMRLVSTLARNMASAFWWRIMARLSRPSVRSLFCGITSLANIQTQHMHALQNTSIINCQWKFLHPHSRVLLLLSIHTFWIHWYFVVISWLSIRHLLIRWSGSLCH